MEKKREGKGAEGYSEKKVAPNYPQKLQRGKEGWQSEKKGVR